MKKILCALLTLILTLSLLLPAVAEEYKVDFSALTDDQAVCASDILAAIVDAMQDYADPAMEEEYKEELKAEFYLYLDCGSLGFDVADLDGDGNPELILCAAEGCEPFFDKMVLNLYTWKDEEEGGFFDVFASGERDRYYWCGDGLFANEGSSGAADSTETTLRFENGALTDLGTVTDPAQYLQYAPLEKLGE